jgi:Na+/phosphate symporter
MKRSNLIFLLIGALFFQSCATIIFGEGNSSQLKKPLKGEKKREIRIFPLVFGIVTIPVMFGVVSLVTDFSTGAIYKKNKIKSNIDKK